MSHDFKRFPELTNSQMQFYYFESPHKQITGPFSSTVTKVIDGDTIKVKWVERDFDFPIRFAEIAAPEMKEDGGHASQSWLEEQLLGKEVEVVPTKSRVEKWGRLLANVSQGGMNMNSMSVNTAHAVKWEDRVQGIPDFNLEVMRWL